MWEIYYIIFSFYYNFLTIMNIHTLLGGLTLTVEPPERSAEHP